MLGAGTTHTTPWSMGVTFGMGQALAGLVLYWNLKRRPHEQP
jgi:hypothetical protein